jgi:hypothetical protein
MEKLALVTSFLLILFVDILNAQESLGNKILRHETKIITMTFEEYSEGDYPHLIFKDISSSEEYDFRFLSENNLNGVSILLDDNYAAFGLKANPKYLKKIFIVETMKKISY